MKNFALLFLVISASLSQKSQATGSWSELYSRSINKIPVIMSSGGLCAGALVDVDLILTAKHCVESQRTPWISWKSTPKKWEASEIIYIDPEYDFALLRLAKVSSQKPIPIRQEPLKEGDEVATIGHPSRNLLFFNPPYDQELTYLISAGVISKVSSEEFIVDLSLSPGNSGGPVFDKSGALVGVVSRKLVSPFSGDVGYIVGPGVINKALANAGIRLGNARPSKWQIPSQLGLALLLDIDGFARSHKNTGHTYYVDFSYTLIDRAVFHWGYNFSWGGYKNFQYGVGYKIYRERSNKVPYALTPSLEWVSYERPQGKQVHWGASLGIRFVSVPFEIRPAWFRHNADNYVNLGFRLGF